MRLIDLFRPKTDLPEETTPVERQVEYKVTTQRDYNDTWRFGVKWTNPDYNYALVNLAWLESSDKYATEDDALAAAAEVVAEHKYNQNPDRRTHVL